jgi:hypothetical protein
MRVIDNIVALRVLWILITPIENTDAFKLGLIDPDGKTVRKAKTSEEKNATSPLHRLVWNLKRMISLVPGGSTRIGSLAAAYLLMRESIENNWDQQTMERVVLESFDTLCQENTINEEVNSLLDSLLTLTEDAPVNATGTATSTDIPVKKSTDKKIIIKRKFNNTLI